MGKIFRRATGLSMGEKGAANGRVQASVRRRNEVLLTSRRFPLTLFGRESGSCNLQSTCKRRQRLASVAENFLLVGALPGSVIGKFNALDNYLLGVSLP